MRRLLLLVLLGALLSACTDRTSLREAKRTIAVADSLDACGQVYADTLALQRAEQAFRECHKQQYARACYWLGRACDKAGLHDKAAVWFVAAARCRPEDLFLRGRINVNLAYYCAQQNANSVATECYKRAVECFRLAGAERHYANTLVSLSRNYGAQGMYREAEEVWQQAAEYDIDSAYIVRLYSTKAHTLYLRGEYEAAQRWLDRLSLESTTDPYICLLAARVCFERGLLPEAVNYVYKLLACQPVDALKISAYYILEAAVAKEGEKEQYVEISHLRADAFRAEQVLACRRAVAVAQIEAFLREGDSDNGGLIFSLLACCVVFGVGIIIFVVCFRRKHHREVPAVVPASPSVPNVESLLINVHKQVESLGLEKALHWDDYTQMCQDVNMYLYGFAQRLEQLPPAAPLSETDVRICILTLLSMPMKQMADYLHRSPNSMKNLKQVTAHKLGVTSAQLRPFLLKLLC